MPTLEKRQIRSGGVHCGGEPGRHECRPYKRDRSVMEAFIAVVSQVGINAAPAEETDA